MRRILTVFSALLFCTIAIAQDYGHALNLEPAKWIWYPSERTLQNTFVLFRKDFTLGEVPGEAKGWIVADSRYRLFVNGERVQWGPAPSDPRWQEADPVDIAPYLRKGINTIAVEVCFFGSGDGTAPIGKPGLLLKIGIGNQNIISDPSWSCSLARSWEP
ncbi:MAG: alpha-L-rhamnosidase, partial [Bacteroidales bacterium]|nr:alpha-L-rhamnosidase [Bacteroidales bacterium]